MAPSSQGVLDRQSAWPNLAGVARLLGIDRSTLSKQARSGRVSCIRLGLGRGEVRISPAEVLRLASVYQRVAIGTVRQALARELAARLSLPEEALFLDLEGLAPPEGAAAPYPAFGLGSRVREIPPRGRSGRRRRVAVPRARQSAGVRPVPIVDLGWLEPGLLTPDDLPSSDFVRALDALRPHELDIRIVDPEPEVISLGDLQPGEHS